MDELHEHLRNFASYYTDGLPEIPVLDHIPTANEFYSNYVMSNRPFVISCVENHLPAVQKFRKYFYLRDKLFEDYTMTCVTPVYFTYPGIYLEKYVVPALRKENLYDILHYNEYPHESEHFYVKQPNNLKDFPLIADDIRADVPWATEAFDCGPTAANLSIGNKGCFTSLHKDEYHNFFYQLKGSREFKLLPPIGHFCLPYRKYKKYQWRHDPDIWRFQDTNEEIEVIPEVIEPDTLEQNGFYRNIKSYVVKIHPGDALYIPMLWYHEYRDSGDSDKSNDCVALNYWYEVEKWDWKFPLFRFLSKLFKVKKPSMYRDASVDAQSELEMKLLEDLFEKFKERL